MRGHGDRVIALALAGVASLLELGPIAALLYQGHDITAVLLAGLAYQVGNAAPRPLQHPLALGVIALAAALVLYLASPASASWLTAIAALSWTLQAVRRNVAAQSAPTPTAHKRVARVAGFILATLAPMAVWLALTLAGLALALTRMRKGAAAEADVGTKAWTHLEWTMVAHQTHYFSYAYAIPVLIADPLLGGVGAAGFWFACGWVSYLSAETLWRRFPLRTVFVTGHLCLAAILALLTLTSGAPVLSVVFWILSGFGGGTVYCLTQLQKNNCGAPGQLERAEDVGHLFGVALALGAVSVFHFAADDLPAVGAVCALAAAFLLMSLHRDTHPSSAHADQ